MDECVIVPNFAYQAVDLNGQVSRGVIAAGTRDDAFDSLLASGVTPVKLDLDSDSQTTTSSQRVPRIPKQAVENFTRELGHLLESGVPLTRAMEVLSRECSQPAVKQLWAGLRDAVSDGASLADAMSRYPNAFSSVQVAMVKAGEQGGFLDRVLVQIAEFRSRERELQGRVKSAMIYPAFLAGLLIGVMVFLLMYFIPQFREIFAEFGEALPILTGIVLSISQTIQDYGLAVLLACVIVFVLLQRAIVTDTGKIMLERAMLAVPGVGAVVSRFALVRFCRLLGTLVGAGVPLVAALRTARDALGNVVLKEAVDYAIDEVQAGEALAPSLGSCAALFPGSVVETIAVAEETGRLESELIRVANYYEQDLNRRLTNLVAVLEPLMLLIMATVVGTIVVSMLLPIFTLQDLIN